MSEEGPIRVGVSSCLLGNEVRFDGGHKRNRVLVEVLGPLVEWVPVCPELEVGMGIPRPPLRLEQLESGRVGLIESTSRRDHSARMQSFAASRVRELRKLALGGYVLKGDSPSCGLGHVWVHRQNGGPEKKGRGFFAEALVAAMPNLPVAEEGQLGDPKLRENFIELLFAYRRLGQL